VFKWQHIFQFSHKLSEAQSLKRSKNKQCFFRESLPIALNKITTLCPETNSCGRPVYFSGWSSSLEFSELTDRIKNIY
jgi:hypothetical protein